MREIPMPGIFLRRNFFDDATDMDGERKLHMMSSTGFCCEDSFESQRDKLRRLYRLDRRRGLSKNSTVDTQVNDE